MTVLALTNQGNSAFLTVIDGIASLSACLAASGAWWNKISGCSLMKEEPEGECNECGNRKKKRQNWASLLKAVK